MNRSHDQPSNGEHVSLVRWAVIGKRPGQRDEYTVLADDSAGPRRQEYQQIVREMIPSNPSGAGPDRVESLPWVHIAPVETAGGQRLAVAIMEWPDQDIRDATGRPAVQTRYFDMELDALFHREPGYHTLHRFCADLQPTDGMPLVFAAQPADPVEVSRFIADFGVSTLVEAAALLLEGAVVMLPDPRLNRLDDRMLCLDAVLALLPYGIRGSLAVSSWTLNDAPHRLRLTFSDRVLSGQTGIRRGNPAVFRSRSAQDYAQRITRFLRDDDPMAISRLVKRLWEDRRAYSVDRPEEVLKALADLDIVYAVYQDLVRGVATVDDVLVLLHRPDIDLALVEPDVAQRLIQEVVDRAGVGDLRVLGRHWQTTVVQSLMVGGALTFAPERTVGLWAAVESASGQTGFLESVIVEAQSPAEFERVAALLQTLRVPPLVRLQAALLQQPAVVIRLLLRAYWESPRDTFIQWIELLFGQPPAGGVMPLWAEPFEAMRAGRPEMGKEHLETAPMRNSRSMLVLFAVAYVSGGPATFLRCDNAWGALHNQLLQRHPEHVRNFRRTVANVVVDDPGAQAALDLLYVAAGERIVRNPASLADEDRNRYVGGLAERFGRLKSEMVGGHGIALAKELTAEGLDSRSVSFLMRLQPLLPLDAGTAVTQQMARRAVFYPQALIGQPAHLVQSLIAQEPKLGVVLSRVQLDQAVRDRVPFKDMLPLCLTALAGGMDMHRLLYHLDEWPGLDDPTVAFRLIEELHQRGPRPHEERKGQSLMEAGLAALLSDRRRPERGRALARWIEHQREYHRQTASFLDRIAKANKPPKETREEAKARRAAEGDH
jgi:hypothetical protein